MEPDAFDSLIEAFLNRDPDAISGMQESRAGRTSRNIQKMTGAPDDLARMATDLLTSGEYDEMIRRMEAGESLRDLMAPARSQVSSGTLMDLLSNFNEVKDAQKGLKFSDRLSGIGRTIGRGAMNTNPMGILLGLLAEELLMGLAQNPEFMQVVGESMESSAERSTQGSGGFRQSPTGA